MIYLHIMRFIIKLIKFCLSVIIAGILIILIFFSIYKDRIYEKTRSEISKELSLSTNMHVNIGGIKYIPPFAMSMDYITISQKDPNVSENQAIDNILLTPDINSIISSRKLNFTMDITNFRYKNFLLNGIFRIASKPVRHYRDIIDPDNIRSISILTSDISFEDFSMKNVFGILFLKNFKIKSGKLQIPYNHKRHPVEFEKIDDENAFSININAENIGANGTVSLKDKNDILVSDLKGMFYTFRFDTNLTIKDYMSSERTFLLTGKIKTDLNSFPFLPGGYGRFFQNNPLTGKFSSDFTAGTKNFSLGSLQINSDISITDLSTNKLLINNISSALTLNNGKISTSSLTASLYSGTATCELELDIISENYPFLFSAEIRDINYKSLITDISGKRSNINGKLFTNLDLGGYLKNTSTYKGKGNIAVINADLGQMPILTPLLGDIYTSFQSILPGLKITTIREASADFLISNRKIHTDNITFLGDDITINGRGYMDFDGNLNFDFEHKILEPEEQSEEWQTALRNIIVNIGKLVKETHLGGTIRDPKWSL